MKIKLHGYVVKGTPKDNDRTRFAVDVESFLEAASAHDLLSVDTKGKTFNINGADYEVLNFTFGSEEPLVLECEQVDP